MKKLAILFVFFGIFSSCTEVIDVDLNEAEPKLVVQANLHIWADGTSSSTVKLTTTAPFFDEEIPVVNNATVTVTTDNGTVYPFDYSVDGIYTSTLVPQLDTAYTLTIIYEGEAYTATEELQSVVPLEYVEQKNDGGFSGDQIELKVFFNDPVNIANFYFFEGLADRGDVFEVYDDEFFDGNEIFGFYSVEDLEAGDEIVFNLYGVNEAFNNFMNILLQQTGSGGGPFETQPATVRGNLVNQTTPENFPMGYFRVSEVSTLPYTVE